MLQHQQVHCKLIVTYYFCPLLIIMGKNGQTSESCLLWIICS